MASDEIITIVDENNLETGRATRAEMRSRNLIHRASYVLVFNTAGELFVQKRTISKDVFPGYYDVAAGGVVLAGESYQESAARELFEELGVESPLTFLFENYYADATNRVWGGVFSCIHNGPMLLQAEEVESGCFMSLAEILRVMNARQPFTPDGIEILLRCLAEGLVPPEM